MSICDKDCLHCPYPDCIAAKKREYYEANRESIAAKKREYYEANRERYNDYMRRYMAERRRRLAGQGG